MESLPSKYGLGQTPDPNLPTHLSPALQQWEKFLSRCLEKRLDQQKFAEYVSILHMRSHYVKPEHIAYLFLRPTPGHDHCIDPRILLYLQILQEKRLVHTPAILRAMHVFSTSRGKAEAHKPAHDFSDKHGDEGDDEGRRRKKPKKSPPPLRWTNSYIGEEPIFYNLAKRIVDGKAVTTAREAISVMALAAQWMSLLNNAAAGFAADEMMGTATEASNNLRVDMEGTRIAVMAMFISLIDKPHVLQVLGKPSLKPIRKMLYKTLATFLANVIQSGAQPMMVQKFDFFRNQTLVAMDPDLETKAKDDEMDNMMDPGMALGTFQLPDMHIPNTRAALYVYINAALIGRPAIDDHQLFSYLHNRYQGDTQNTTIDLILASFDVLANAVFRNESEKTAHVLRSYLINKVPLLVKTLSHSLFPPFTTEHCIREALRQVDQNAFPTISAMFDNTSSNNTFTDSVRQDFCFACALHGLIPVSSIEGLLGDMTYQTLPSSGRYEKNTLVQECLADPERIQGLVGVLDNMDGNVGAVCQALVEVMKRLCENKETLPLKSLAHMLAKKPLSLDVLLLFENPVTILRPLCDLLDEWRYEDDQGEYQLVYEEFGAVLLLLLSFVHRYGLSVADLGLVQAPDSFVFKLLNKGYLSRTLDELSDEETAHLGNWITGFFDSDSGGLSDDIMSSCTPQEFYLLIPTLFNQIVLAISSGVLTDEILKSGVEYLVDAFLLPCLVTALTWLGTHLWVDRPAEQKAVIRILQLVLTPKSISSEATSLLGAVLTTVARPLDHSLRTYQRRDPKSQDVEPLLRSLRDFLPVSRRVVSANHNELESWAASRGLAAALRATVIGLVTWALGPDLNVMPTSYTHRQLLSALRFLGAKKTLSAMIDEIVKVVNAVAGNGNNPGNPAAGTSGVGTGGGPVVGVTAAGQQGSQLPPPPSVPPPPAETVGVIYDTVAALICAPDVSETSATSAPPQHAPNEQAKGENPQQQQNQQQPKPQRRTGLREALRYAAEESAVSKQSSSHPSSSSHTQTTASQSSTSQNNTSSRPGGGLQGNKSSSGSNIQRPEAPPSSYAEVTIRLYRRVEALLIPYAPPPQASHDDQPGHDEHNDNVVAAAVNDADLAAAAAGVGVDMSMDMEGMDMGGADGMSLDLDMSALDSTGAGGGGGGSTAGGSVLGGMDLDTSAFGDFGSLDFGGGAGDDLLLGSFDGYGIGGGSGSGSATGGGGGGNSAGGLGNMGDTLDWEGMDMP
ncbi:hypothetical protein MKZ38_005801 [Zalerion maritima]|uniref:Mediator of RNA polymerase II transcription subunit 5 n=1 Tax=Zalerion maritima TaxID=339359 RepID=A0AAD5WX15_9PEZI|nr:hypothetical protein MKZ38_005801 [Zalerion maritima]